jgi:hypothetical protein
MLRLLLLSRRVLAGWSAALPQFGLFWFARHSAETGFLKGDSSMRMAGPVGVEPG